MKQIIAALAACLCSAALVPLAQAQDLHGWWRATLSHAGQTDDVYLRLEPAAQASAAFLTIPSANMRDIPVGAVVLEGDAVSLPGIGMTLRHHAADASWRGLVPSALIPHQQIEARFVRSSAPPPPVAYSAAEPAPRAAWVVDVGAPVWAGLARYPAARLVYAATEAGQLHALHEEDGSRVWVRDLGASLRATPTVRGRRLYVASDDAVTALDARTGDVIWSRPFGPPRAGRLPISNPNSSWDHYSSSVAVRHGVAAVGSRDGCLHLLDADSGRQRWRECTDGLITATPALDASRVYSAGFDGIARAYSIRDGQLIWSHDTHAPIPRDVGLAGGFALVGSRTYELIALDAASGEPSWRRYFWFSWVDSSPVVRDSVIYIGSSDATSVFALDGRTGAQLWRARAPGWAWARPLVTERFVYAGAVGGVSYLGERAGAFMAIERTTGRVRWLLSSEPTESGALSGFASSAVAGRGGRVYVADLAGRIYALDAES